MPMRTVPVTKGAEVRVLDWLVREKYFLSERRGYDVGVPDTIDYLFKSRELALKTNPGVRDEFQRHLAAWVEVPKREEIIALFFHYHCDGKDEPSMGRTELARFGSQIYSVPVSEVVMNAQLVDDYMKAYDLLSCEALKRISRSWSY